MLSVKGAEVDDKEAYFHDAVNLSELLFLLSGLLFFFRATTGPGCRRRLGCRM
jgi:hypothetical protein